MERLELVNVGEATGSTKELLNGAKSQLGMIPNLFRAIALSPVVLENYMNESQLLAKGMLRADLREQIALTVAGLNQCDYCASAHTALGKRAGLSNEELKLSLHAKATDAKAQAALTFTRAILDSRGSVNDSELADVRAAGFSDGEIVEMVAHVAHNIFTNYLNNLVKTEVDFPLVRSIELECAA